MLEYIDAGTLRIMFLAGTKSLESNKDWINELNVFPVPDGDTGTNMTLTVKNAVDELLRMPKDATLTDIVKTISTGTLRGARGNSGVILSQLCRGFSKEIEALLFKNVINQLFPLNEEYANIFLKSLFFLIHSVTLIELIVILFDSYHSRL